MGNRKLLIDTSIVIEHLRKTEKKNSILFKISKEYSIYISTITVFELFAGASNVDKKNDVDKLLKTMTILDFDIEISKESAELFRDLRSKNKMIEFRDIFIAATAIYNNLEVLTLNRNHFKRVRGIKLIDVE